MIDEKAARRITHVAVAAAFLNAGWRIEEPTLPLPVTPARGGCRTRVGGMRCGHAYGVHEQVGHGVRERCRCGCPAFRTPWGELAVDAVLIVATVVVVVVLGAVIDAALLTALGWLLT